MPFDLKPCKFCHQHVKITPLVTKSRPRDTIKHCMENLYKVESERVETPAFFTVICNSPKCKNFLHKNPQRLIAEKTEKEAAFMWNQMN